MKDAVERSENGLYVLLQHKRGDKNAPPYHENGSVNDENYKIIGQSYAWKSKTGNLCLDSIECLKASIPNDTLRQILTDFATQVIENDSTIHRVTLGAGGKTPYGVFTEVLDLPEAIRQGQFYGDATNQYLLAKREHLSAAEVKEAAVDDFLMKIRINERNSKVICYLFEHLPNKLQAVNELRALLKENPKLLSQLDKYALFRFFIYSDKLPPVLSDLKPINLNATTSHSLASLLWQEKNVDEFVKIIPYIPKERLLEVVNDMDYAHGKAELGRSILQEAADNPEAFNVILKALEALPEEQRCDAITKMNQERMTVLSFAHGNALKVVLEILPLEQRLAAVKNRYKTVDVNLNRPDDLKIILEALPPEQRFDFIKETSYGITLLRSAVDRPIALKVILEALSKEQRLDAVKEKDKYGLSVFHFAATHPEALKAIFDALPQEQCLDAENKRTILYFAATHPEALALILELYPHDQRLAAVTEKAGSRGSVLHQAATYPEVLKAIFEALPQEQRLDAVKEKDSDGFSVLHRAATHPEALKAILEALPQEQRLAAVKEKDVRGLSVLYTVRYEQRKLEVLKVIFTSLPFIDFSLDLLRDLSTYDFTLAEIKTILLEKITQLAKPKTEFDEIREKINLSDSIESIWEQFKTLQEEKIVHPVRNGAQAIDPKFFRPSDKKADESGTDLALERRTPH